MKTESKTNYVAQLDDGSFVDRTLGRTDSLLRALRLGNDYDLGHIVKDHYKDFTVVPVTILIMLEDNNEI